VNKYKVRKYNGDGFWPVFLNKRETHNSQDEAADHYGDAECPSCDRHFRSEGELFHVGEKCERCGCEVIAAKGWFTK